MCLYLSVHIAVIVTHGLYFYLPLASETTAAHECNTSHTVYVSRAHKNGRLE